MITTSFFIKHKSTTFYIPTFSKFLCIIGGVFHWTYSYTVIIPVFVPNLNVRDWGLGHRKVVDLRNRMLVNIKETYVTVEFFIHFYSSKKEKGDE